MPLSFRMVRMVRSSGYLPPHSTTTNGFFVFPGPNSSTSFFAITSASASPGAIGCSPKTTASMFGSSSARWPACSMSLVFAEPVRSIGFAHWYYGGNVSLNFATVLGAKSTSFILNWSTASATSTPKPPASVTTS